MRLLVDAHVFDDLGQGSRTYLKGLYDAVLRLNKSDEFYFAVNDVNNLSREMNTETPNVHVLQYGTHNRLLRLGRALPKMIREHKIDWAHYQYVSPIAKACREIVTIHDLLFLDYPQYFPRSYRAARNILFRRSAKRAEWVLTVSEFSKEAIIRHYGVSRDRIVITPNGILDVFRDGAGATSTIGDRLGLDRFVLYVSRFEPRKNQAGLLQAFSDLKLWEEGIQLVFVGGQGIPSPAFDGLYRALPDPARKNVLILGDVDLLDLTWLYQNCSLFAYPSFIEGFGIPPLEALACGANVLCSGTTAMAEFKFLGERLIDPHNQKELTNKIRHYLDHPDFPERQVAQEWMRTNYSWEVSAKRFLALFR